MCAYVYVCVCVCMRVFNVVRLSCVLCVKSVDMMMNKKAPWIRKKGDVFMRARIKNTESQ